MTQHQASIKALSPSTDLAYLLGVITGDGCLSRTSRTYKLIISCTAAHPELITAYSQLIESVTGRTVRICSRNNGTYYEVYTYGNELPVLLNIPVGKKSTMNYQVAEWIFTKPEYIRKFLRGLIETDGGIYHEFRNGGWCSRCLFTAFYEPIMQAFLKSTVMLGYEFRRKGNEARLTRTVEVKRLVAELDITKAREYKYMQSRRIRGVAQLGSAHRSGR